MAPEPSKTAVDVFSNLELDADAATPDENDWRHERPSWVHDARRLGLTHEQYWERVYRESESEEPFEELQARAKLNARGIAVIRAGWQRQARLLRVRIENEEYQAALRRGETPRTKPPPDMLGELTRGTAKQQLAEIALLLCRGRFSDRQLAEMYRLSAPTVGKARSKLTEEGVVLSVPRDPTPKGPRAQHSVVCPTCEKQLRVDPRVVDGARRDGYEEQRAEMMCDDCLAGAGYGR